MKKITHATEQKLMAVIEKTAALVSDGESPNDAIIKAATAGGLRPGDVSLVVHAFNTGRTTRQRQQGDDIFSKSAEFDMADTKTILDQMYPDNVKTASAIEQSQIISSDYSYSPKPMLARKASWEKRARNVNWREINGETITPPPPLPTDPNHLAKMAMVKIDKMKVDMEESRRKKANAFDMLAETFTDLTTYFRQGDAKPMPVVKEAVILLHGDKGEQIMDQLVRVTPALEKLATHRTGNSLLGQAGREKFAVSVEDLDCTAAPFDTIAKLVRQIDDYKEKRAAFAATETTYIKEAGETIAPFVHPITNPSILGGSSDDREKLGFFDPLKPLGAYHLMSKTLEGVGDTVKGPENNIEVDKTMAALQDPAHEQKLRGINTQAMLQDLMLNDEVISGYGQQEVADAYNDIVQISPSVADQRMLVQNLLRKKLQQGQLDTFEQDQLLGFEDQLRKQTVPMQAGNANASII